MGICLDVYILMSLTDLIKLQASNYYVYRTYAYRIDARHLTTGYNRHS
jgi:hypothetical protein